MKKVCPVCKIEYTTSRKRRLDSKYCSKQCFLDRNKKDTIKSCLQCGKEFKTYPNWIKRGGGKYCSHKCSSIGQSKKIDRVCEICGVFNRAYWTDFFKTKLSEEETCIKH